MLRDGTAWVHKENNYSLPFILDSKKIVSLVDNLKGLYKDPPSFIAYEVFYSDGISEKTQRLDDILDYDNHQKKRITKLKLTLKEDDIPLHYSKQYGTEIVFKEKPEYKNETTTIEIAGPEKWVDLAFVQIRELLSEFVPDQPHRIISPFTKKLFTPFLGINIGLLSPILFGLAILLITNRLVGGIGVDMKDFPDKLAIPVHLAEKIHYDPDKKLIRCKSAMTENEEAELLSLHDDPSYKKAIRALYSKSQRLSYAIFLLTISACLLVILLIMLFLLTYLYPLGVFLIGEEKQRYKKRVDLRGRILWSVLVAGILAFLMHYIY